MANVIVDDKNLTAIGNSIRSKNGKSDLYTPAEMALAIENIQAGISTFNWGDENAGYATTAEMGFILAFCIIVE